VTGDGTSAASGASCVTPLQQQQPATASPSFSLHWPGPRARLRLADLPQLASMAEQQQWELCRRQQEAAAAAAAAARRGGAAMSWSGPAGVDTWPVEFDYVGVVLHATEVAGAAGGGLQRCALLLE
jgi:hypothetical protein